MLRMRTTFIRSEIQEVLEKAMGQLDTITLWQLDGEERRLFFGKLVEVSDDKTAIELQKLKSESGHTLQPDKTLYIHGNYEKFLFKRDTFIVEEMTIKVKTPSELKLVDHREYDRFTYRYQDHKTIHYFLEHPKTGRISLSSPIVDISIKGIGFVVSEEEFRNFSIGQTIDITAITDQKLYTPVHASVKTLIKYDVKESEARSIYRVGLEFVDLMNTVNFKSVQTVIEKKQKKQQGLQINSFCGLTEEEQQRIMANLSANEPRLASEVQTNIEYIDRLRYLTIEMKREFFQEVNIPIFATALRLSTKETIFELMDQLTDNIREEFIFQLKDQKAISVIKKAQDSICDFMKAKEKAGELVLDAKSYITYV